MHPQNCLLDDAEVTLGHLRRWLQMKPIQGLPSLRRGRLLGVSPGNTRLQFSGAVAGRGPKHAGEGSATGEVQQGRSFYPVGQPSWRLARSPGSGLAAHLCIRVGKQQLGDVLPLSLGWEERVGVVLLCLYVCVHRGWDISLPLLTPMSFFPGKKGV